MNSFYNWLFNNKNIKRQNCRCFDDTSLITSNNFVPSNSNGASCGNINKYDVATTNSK
jgi:hypothetical protein